MRWGVEPSSVTTAAATVRDLAVQVGVLDAASIGALVAAGMPQSVSARLAVHVCDRLAQELSTLGRDLVAHADALAHAADAYDGAERGVAHQIGRSS